MFLVFGCFGVLKCCIGSCGMCHFDLVVLLVPWRQRTLRWELTPDAKVKRERGCGCGCGCVHRTWVRLFLFRLILALAWGLG